MLQDSGLPPLAIMVLIIVIFVVLGCLMDSLSMSSWTIPFFLPVVSGLDSACDGRPERSGSASSC